jgi:hypothetical protein
MNSSTSVGSSVSAITTSSSASSNGRVSAVKNDNVTPKLSVFDVIAKSKLDHKLIERLLESQHNTLNKIINNF